MRGGAACTEPQKIQKNNHWMLHLPTCYTILTVIDRNHHLLPSANHPSSKPTVPLTCALDRHNIMNRQNSLFQSRVSKKQNVSAPEPSLTADEGPGGRYVLFLPLKHYVICSRLLPVQDIDACMFVCVTVPPVGDGLFTNCPWRLSCRVQIIIKEVQWKITED